MKKNRPGRAAKPQPANRQTRLPVTAGAELLPFLIANLSRLSRNNIKSLLTRGQVSVDGHIVRQYNHPLRGGQEVLVDGSPARGREAAPGLRILHEDSSLLVVDKPAGLLTIASDTEKKNTAYHRLTDYVREKRPASRIFIVHRLDRDTSGVIVFARQEEVKRRFQERWRELIRERTYVALVEGRVDRKEDTVRSWLLETRTKHIYSSGTPGDGLEAVTHYRVLRTSSQYSLLEIKLETGRKNQIRVHMHDIGHPVAGDKKYGSQTDPLRRLALHARVLAFEHPMTGQPMRFQTEIPPQFIAMLK